MLTLIHLLACNGDDSGIKALKPDIVVTPEVLDFGMVVEDYTAPLNVEVINAGQGVLTIEDVTVNGDGADAFIVGAIDDELAHDVSWPLQVTFAPKDPLTYTATLTIHTDDPDSPQVPVTLTGQGIVAPTPDIDCDPLSLDFGVVPAGTPGSALWTTCTNVGDDALTIDGWSQSGSGVFRLATPDPTGYVLDPGESTQLIFTYTPSTDAGDNGGVVLTTNDPDEPTTTITLVGNGGGDFEYPVAVLDCPGTAEPRTTATVGGGDSNDPNGYEPLLYHWTVLGPYDPVTTTESGTDLFVQLDLAGEYRVSLQVENSIGLLSAPAVCTIDVIPVEEFHVELIWKDLPDLDLHLLTSEGELFVEPYDCNYCNISPEWGAAGRADNPTLDLDALSSPPGVENINIEAPADDNYHIKVHYYEDNGGGDAVANVNVYLYGVLEASYSRVLQRNKVWDVATVVWPEGYVVEETTDLYDATLRTCE